MIYILRRRGYGKELTRLLAERLGAFSLTNPRKIRAEDTVIRWGNPPLFTLENRVKILNNRNAVNRSTNKLLARNILSAARIRCPKTTGHWREATAPAIVRPVNHFGGHDFFFCETPLDIRMAVLALQARGVQCYLSEYIKKDREFRVFVVQGRVICLAEKIVENKEQIAWNNSEGSHFETLGRKSWPIAVAREAIKATNCLGLDFGAVDVISKDDIPYVLEINTAFNLESEYRIDCLVAALAWAVDEKEVPPIGVKDRNWKDFVHPAVSDKARE